MRALAVTIAIFALLALDLSKNDGDWTGTVADFVNHVGYEMRVALSR